MSNENLDNIVQTQDDNIDERLVKEIMEVNQVTNFLLTNFGKLVSDNFDSQHETMSVGQLDYFVKNNLNNIDNAEQRTQIINQYVEVKGGWN